MWAKGQEAAVRGRGRPLACKNSHRLGLAQMRQPNHGLIGDLDQGLGGKLEQGGSRLEGLLLGKQAAPLLLSGPS